MTSPSETTTETPAPTVKRGRGRPAGVKNGDGVARKKKPVKKPSIARIRETAVQANFEAIVANANFKNAKAEIERLNGELHAAKLHIEKVEKQHKAALIVIGYLEGKVFNE